MSETKDDIQALAGTEGVFVQRQGKLSCSILRMRDDSLCLYSPLPKLTPGMKRGLDALGVVSVLLAPNHYHNRGLKPYEAAFPTARLVAPPEAQPRLEKQTGLRFEGLELLEPLLPPGTRILEPEGLKTGEIWLEVDAAEDRIWIVCDGFSAPAAPNGGYADKPQMLGTFPKYGAKDGAAYRVWVEDRIAERPPTMLVPCHGSPVKSPDLGPMLSEVLAALF